MELRVLGVSGGLAASAETTAFLLEQHILFDGGTGVGQLSQQQMCDIDTLVLTHAHLDHICGAALMLATTIDKRSSPLTIYAPEAVLTVLRKHLFNWQIWPDFSVLPTEESAVLRYKAVEPEESFEIAGITLEAVPLSHTVPSFAYIASRGDRSFCFCGDTAATERLWQRINSRGGVDQLFIELSYPQERAAIAVQAGHYDTVTLARDLAKLEKPLQLNLMHAKPGYEEQLRVEVENQTGLGQLAVRHCQLGDRFNVL